MIQMVILMSNMSDMICGENFVAGDHMTELKDDPSGKHIVKDITRFLRVDNNMFSNQHKKQTNN